MQVAILSEGDVVSELMIVVDGQAQSFPAGHALPGGPGQHRASATGAMAIEMHKSFHSGAMARRRHSLVGHGSATHMGSSGTLVSSGDFTALGKGPLPGAPHRDGSALSRLGAAPRVPDDVALGGAAAPAAEATSGARPLGGEGAAPAPHRMGSHRRNSLLFGADGQSMAGSWGGATAFTATNGAPCATFEEAACIGAVPFFTDSSSIENVVAVEMTRVIVIGKSALDAINATYPQQVRPRLTVCVAQRSHPCCVT